MEINFSFLWHISNADQQLSVDPVLFALLAAVKQTGSLKQATVQCQVSYRFAWGLVNKWQAFFEQPLVILERGRGAKLSALGEKILFADQNLLARFSPDLDNFSAQVKQQMDKLMVGKHAPSLNIFASHGLAVSALRDLINQNADFKIDLQFYGSLKSLRSMNNGDCDIAGFHIPAGPMAEQLIPQYLDIAHPDTHQLIYVVKRNQGLMVARDNPKHITSIKSLLTPEVNFINRQPDSGTRLLFDHLLAAEGIEPRQVKGYQHEEFTHMAVAAMVASGAADVGFGIAPMAAKFNLQFIPIVWEHYCLAVPLEIIDDPRVKQIKSLLRSEKFRQSLIDYAGYDATRSGNEVKFDYVFNTEVS